MAARESLHRQLGFDLNGELEATNWNKFRQGLRMECRLLLRRDLACLGELLPLGGKAVLHLGAFTFDRDEAGFFRYDSRI